MHVVVIWRPGGSERGVRERDGGTAAVRGGSALVKESHGCFFFGLFFALAAAVFARSQALSVLMNVSGKNMPPQSTGVRPQLVDALTHFLFRPACLPLLDFTPPQLYFHSAPIWMCFIFLSRSPRPALPPGWRQNPACTCTLDAPWQTSSSSTSFFLSPSLPQLLRILYI